ncbi:hypothetical protein EIN_327890 [Entamoeba invadens IP1]|uniref:TLDc domain-containing protein n=1 Tax=Entamoeba invadens IP1 TaxID=370355 RepID=A0A0A1TXL8_ENTIV|nr:hypothetical protein EIN_327890 [Entamoeba invadens IP1]ELP86132.1 hypothetical protein EIN_327890 [Entamoeba invadens IP1]|eukprot:XP_004185478.1 hypothetical protein EIN_327890 [Entamoeba invadens IP1]
MGSLFQGKVLLHYSDNSNDIVDEGELEIMRTRAVSTKYSNVSFTSPIVEIPVGRTLGKYFVQYLRDEQVKFSWYTRNKQVDLFLEFLKFGLTLKEALSYTQVTSEVFSSVCGMNLQLVLDADKDKQCEDNVLPAVSKQDGLKVAQYYFNETDFLNAFLSGGLTEAKLDKRKTLGVSPTHSGKQFVNRNTATAVGEIVKNGKTPLGLKMLNFFQEYTNLSEDLFEKNVQMLANKWKSEGNKELYELCMKYCGASQQEQRPAITIAGESVTHAVSPLARPTFKTCSPEKKEENVQSNIVLGTNKSAALNIQNTQQSVSPSAPISQITFQNPIQGIDLELLKKWTGMRNLRVLYDKSMPEVDILQFNTAICGKKNMMVIVNAEDGSVFGSYSSIEVPPPVNWIKKDSGHFLFTLVNHKNIEPTRFYPLKLGNSVYIFQNDYMISVLAVQGAFKINIRTESTFASKFPVFYNDTTKLGNALFVDTPDKFAIKSLLVLEFF